MLLDKGNWRLGSGMLPSSFPRCWQGFAVLPDSFVAPSVQLVEYKMSRRHMAHSRVALAASPEAHDAETRPRPFSEQGVPLVLSPTEEEVLEYLRPLVSAYPGINHWFQQTVVPGLRTDTRRLEVVRQHGHIVALGIAKRDAEERKLCTVRVLPGFQGQGLGHRVIDPLLRWLDCDRPFCTVSAATRPQFDRIFAYYGFAQTASHAGLYLPGRVEEMFNAGTPPELEAGPAVSRNGSEGLRGAKAFG